MITHTKCKGNMVATKALYYPLIAEVLFTVNDYVEAADIESHNIRQIYTHVGNPETLPKAYCITCRDWFPFGEFVLSFSCDVCGAPAVRGEAFRRSRGNCSTGFEAHSIICDKCAAKNCIPCNRRCAAFKYYCEVAYNKLQKLSKEL